jgi:hypothetical protein
MLENEEVLEDHDSKNTEVPAPVKKLAVIAFILHGFLLSGVLLSIMVLIVSSYDTAAARTSGVALIGLLTSQILVTILSVISIIGAYKMRKGKKGGFVLLAIGSSVLGGLVLFSSFLDPNNRPQIVSFIFGILIVLLVPAFAKQLKFLK